MSDSYGASGDFHFDDAEADRAVAFFGEVLRHTKGRWARHPLELEPWQVQIVRDLFGWKRADGSRRYRTAYVSVPRKNGKSTLLAGIGCFLLVADEEEGGELYSVAAERDQAAIIFDMARRMVELSPVLAKRIKPFRRAMVHEETDSWWRVLSSDAPTKHGLNPHGVLFDELHAQPNRELWDVMVSGSGAREQPLLLAITTAGYDRNSICFELYEYARQVREGVIDDPSFYSFVTEAAPDDDWEDREVWARANPNLGVSVSVDHLEEQFAKAKASPAAQNAFRRLHLNQWTRQRDRWLDLARWDASAGPLMPAELELACEGRVAYGGLDLAQTTDIAAFVLVVPPPEGDEADGDFGVVCRFFVPEEGAYQREKRDRVPYQAWARDGWITLTEGDVIDYRAIRKEILELADRYQIREVAFDRWGSAQIASDLQDDGLELVQFGQGFASMNAPTKELLHLVLAGRLHHGGHPVLRWMADNLVVRQDPAGNVKPDKAKSTEKIDGMVACVMALDRAVRLEGGTPGSVYDQRGMRSL